MGEVRLSQLRHRGVWRNNECMNKHKDAAARRPSEDSCSLTPLHKPYGKNSLL